MLKLLVLLLCSMIAIVSTNGASERVVTLIECEGKCNADYTICTRLSRTLMMKYKGCMAIEDDCRKSCREKKGELEEIEHTDED